MMSVLTARHASSRKLLNAWAALAESNFPTPISRGSQKYELLSCVEKLVIARDNEINVK